MRMTHRNVVRVGALALGALFALTGCNPETPMEPVAQTGTTPSAAASSGAPSPSPSASPSASPSPSPSPSKTTPAAPIVCPQGPHQLEVETALAAIGTYGAIVVDGKQSDTDCATIKAFQRRMGIQPVNGRAGDTTSNVAKRIAATDINACHAGTATMACVDLTHQTFFVMKGGKVVLGPTVTRTGKPGFRTVAGMWSVGDRSLKHWSTPYKVWLPYWQNFYNGQGLHETTTYIHDMSIGSHGCVNLLHNDAKAAYNLLTYGSKVHVYGRRPGT